MPRDNGYANGRPSDCTPEIQETILGALRKGNYRKTAAGAAGIHRKTLQNWETAGLEGREPYASFLAAMLKAECECELMLLDKVLEEKGAAWIMERRYAAEWSGKVKQATAEAVDALTDKLKAVPELHKQVVEVLAADAAPPGAQH